MSERNNVRRHYSSERRQEQARETRRRIVEAARRLFVEWGYAGTTMEAIGSEAGVAVETVYAAFRNKRALLARVIDVSVVGDDEPAPLLERPGPQEVRRERDQRRQSRLFARDIREIMERVGPLFEVMRNAARTEPQIAELLQELLQRRLQGMTFFVQALAGNGPLRESLSEPEAADIVWTLTSAEVHRLLTVDRGWSGDRYESWLGDILVNLLLPTG